MSAAIPGASEVGSYVLLCGFRGFTFLLNQARLGPVQVSLHVAEGTQLYDQRHGTDIAHIELHLQWGGLARQLLAFVQLDAFTVQIDRRPRAAAARRVVDADEGVKTLIM